MASIYISDTNYINYVTCTPTDGNYFINRNNDAFTQGNLLINGTNYITIGNCEGLDVTNTVTEPTIGLNNLYITSDSNNYVVNFTTAEETIESKILSKRMAIREKSMSRIRSRSECICNLTPEETIAVEALREIVTENEFRKYLKYGFVVVKGKSGALYQVYRNKTHIKVWVGGKVVEEICVYLKAVEGKRAPDTDKVVAFKTMIETDEEAFKALGNCYRMAA